MKYPAYTESEVLEGKQAEKVLDAVLNGKMLTTKTTKKTLRLVIEQYRKGKKK